jgi:hypothetical protein
MEPPEIEYSFFVALDGIKIGLGPRSYVTLNPAMKLRWGENKQKFCRDKVSKIAPSLGSVEHEHIGRSAAIVTGSFQSNEPSEKIQRRAYRICDYILNFFDYLWIYKDNIVRPDQCWAYSEKTISVGRSMARPSTPGGDYWGHTQFSYHELSQIVKQSAKQFEPLLGSEVTIDSPGLRLIEHSETRFQRLMKFIGAARRSVYPEFKIVNYCTALECFLGTGRSELKYKVSERCAILAEQQMEEWFDKCSLVYDARSAIVHSGGLGKKQNAVQLSIDADQLCRVAAAAYFKRSDRFREVIDSNDSKQIEKFFRSLIFQ